jgi:ATP phosphoribosyltransferase
MNVPRSALGGVLELLPALHKPTVAALSDADWVDVSAIVREDLVARLIPRLKDAGAAGIAEYEVRKLVE